MLSKQHNEILTRVLESCKSRGITLNLEKSVFFKNNLKYYGFMFSKKGVTADPQKIQEIRVTPSPENKKSLTKYSRTDQDLYMIIVQKHIIYKNYYRGINITYRQKHISKLLTTLNNLLALKVVFPILTTIDRICLHRR